MPLPAKFFYLALVITCVSILPLGLSAQNKPAPPPVIVDVELLVPGPDGRPVSNTELTIHMPDLPLTPDIQTKTDEHGIARFKAPAGGYRMSISAHEVGYGQIGAYEFIPGRVARPQMPRLMAYGSIDGTFLTDYCRGDVTIEATGGGYAQYGTITIPPDSPGHFHIADAGSGNWMIRVLADKRPCAATSVSFALAPGEHLRDLKIPGLPESQPDQPVQVLTPVPVPTPAKPKGPVVWVRGTVRDEAGKPIAGASVMALGTFQGSIRMYEITSQTVTDSEGRYELKGQGALDFFSATVIATAPGHPPAWAWPSFPSSSWADEDAPTQDLVLASQSGKLNVTVVRNGEPVKDISVALYLENANLRDMWAMPTGNDQPIHDAVYPVAKTDERGVASFENLLPGRYRILATGFAQSVRNSLYGLSDLGGFTAQSIGVPVQVGATTNYKINLYEQKNKVAFRALQADGTPLHKYAGISFGPVDTIAWMSGVDFDSSGQATRDMEHAGLWQMQVTFRDTPITESPIRGPYFLAAGHVAASPNLDSTNSPAFTAVRVEPPSARVQVLDLKGDPLHVTVLIGDGFGYERLSATTDEHGEALFTGLTAHTKYYVTLSSAPGTDVQNVDLGKFLVRPAGTPLKDVKLPVSPDPRMLPPEQLHAEPGIREEIFIAEVQTETRVLMRQVPLHYVYGVIRSSKAPNLGEWVCCWPEYPLLRQGVESRSLPSTGEYVIGPFFPGEARVTFGLKTGPSNYTHYHALVNVPNDNSGPIRFDIDADKYSPDQPDSPDPMMTASQTAVMGMGGISAKAGGAHHLVGKVYYADGKTPALGAQVLYFQRHSFNPSLLAMTDALGELQPRGLWYTAQQAGTEKSAGLDSPTVIAFLPGKCGASIQTGTFRPGEPLRFVLPKPVSAAGRVTVGGVSPLHRPGAIHVMAAYQGKGALKPYLSVTTTADADGRFTLAGLTPGDYLVQAALDDIWLSQPEKLHVEDANPRSLELKIPLPGAPVRVDVRDRSGKPVLGASLTVDQTGPLSMLWPREWITDGAGSAYMPTLAAGKHTLHVSGETKPVNFKVTALPSPPVTVQVKVAQGTAAKVKTIDETSPYQP